MSAVPIQMSRSRHAANADADDELLTPLALMCLPWPPLDSPYLALGTLAGYARGADVHRTVTQHHLYLNWFQLLRSEFGDSARDLYMTVAEEDAYLGAGDFVFAAGIFPGSAANVDRFIADCAVKGSPLPALPRLRSLAESFVADCAADLARTLPANAVAGLSTTFTQTVPSLALCQALKRLRPDVHTVLGGGNMNAERADVLLRALPELDTVIFGEGELSLVTLLHHIDEGVDPEGPGIVTRRAVETGRHALRPTWVPLNANPVPDMAPYFEQLADTGLDAEIEPRLAFELGRGCWWGEKHHCTFCGLNGENMAFRRKTRDDVHQDILNLVEEHRVLDVIFADNILHPADIAAVFERLPSDLDLRMHLEVKSNMKREEIQRLRRHGVWHMQPGIESLARRPLELMRKGTTPWQNVRFLRDAEEFGITTSWNILTGFPGETVEDYAEMLEQLPKLFHLQPPGSVGVIGLVRYSPLFNDPSLGVASKRPTPHTEWTYTGLPPSDIEALAEVFECEGVFDVGELVAARMRPLTTDWRLRHHATFLVEERQADAVTITRSDGAKVHTLTLAEEWAIDLWELLRPGRTPKALDRFLSELSDRHASLTRELMIELDVEHRVLYHDEGTLITLPTRYEDHVPYRLTTF